MATDSLGNVYISDASGDKIHKFTNDGALVMSWPTTLSHPEAIAVDADDNLYVATTGPFGPARIEKFTSDGTPLLWWGSAGSGDGQFWFPRDLAIDGEGNVYVADTGNDRIQKFTSDGTFITKWPIADASSGDPWDGPSGVAVGLDGRVYVVDSTAKLQAFTSDGTLLATWGSLGSADGQFMYYAGELDVDRDGFIYVADLHNDRVQKFTPDGQHVWSLTGGGAGPFDQVWGLAVDDDFNLFVNDAANYRIQKFRQNGPPMPDARGPYSGNEGAAITLSAATATDPDSDPLTLSWTVDTSPTSANCGFSDPAALNPDLTCDDNGTFTVTLTADDGTAAPVSDDATVTVANVAPDIESVDGSLDPLEVGVLTPVTVEFTDPGSGDTHNVSWVWGDTGSNTQNGVTSPATESHEYLTPGVYAVEVTVVDDDGGSDTETYEFVVIYDPDGGFVTGGGWIDSPAGAYVADPTLTGKANFGFVSKYKKGASVPEGSTGFQFKAGDLNFHSDSYDWLVVAGQDKAKYKGTGTINGSGNYGFMLTALDNGNSGDTFRIRIWDKDDNDAPEYDNKMGFGYDGYDGTVIGGGNIKVHK